MEQSCQSTIAGKLFDDHNKDVYRYYNTQKGKEKNGNRHTEERILEFMKNNIVVDSGGDLKTESSISSTHSVYRLYNDDVITSDP